MDTYYGGPNQQPNPDQPIFQQQETLNSSRVYSKVFLFFGIALLITGAVSIGLSYVLNIFSNYILYYTLTGISSFAIFGLSIYISFKGFSMGDKLVIPYCLYAVCMGILLSGCSLWVPSPYIFGLVICITAALFLLMCGIGVTIGNKVGILGTLLIGALIGSGILGLVSFFVFPLMLTGASASLEPIFWIGEFLFLFILLLYVGIDMWSLKRIATSNTLISTNMCVYFALRLYSDFISILVRILRVVAIALANRDN